MTITDADFDREAELQDWTFANISTFFGDCILLPGFRISTTSGKQGVPDGFAFHLVQQSWWVVECELLRHGVWPHIAEQITRFVVALRNSSTLRVIRDKLFERIIADHKQDKLAAALGTDACRLLQQLELFIETVSPSVAVFIDDTDQDLLDFCNALDISTAVYRVKKYLVNGHAEYYSPDTQTPAIVTAPQEATGEGVSFFDVIQQLGNGEVVDGRLKCFKLNDGRIVKLQYSKFHERHQAYWYGITPTPFQQAKELGCTHCVFIMESAGFVVAPIETVEQYLATTYTTNNADGSVRHYHLHLSPPPEVVLKGYGNADDIDVTSQFHSFE